MKSFLFAAFISSYLISFNCLTRHFWLVYILQFPLKTASAKAGLGWLTELYWCGIELEEDEELSEIGKSLWDELNEIKLYS